MSASKRDVIIGQLKDRLSMHRVQISVIFGFTAVAAFAVSVILVAIAGMVMKAAEPDAITIGQFLNDVLA